jgi:hypothetical protein
MSLRDNSFWFFSLVKNSNPDKILNKTNNNKTKTTTTKTKKQART